MKHSLLALSLLAMPVTALALDYSHGSSAYSDSASFSVAERAGIDVLTNLGAVSGNPDGTFAASRTLNRAEFLKIVLNIAPKDGSIQEGDMPPGDGSVSSSAPWCFPDVKAGDWFMPYVCTAKQNGIVAGYPDGLFHPERAVNYVEAVKILAEVFDYDLPSPSPTERWAWYTPYVRAAMEHEVLFSDSLSLDASLTRGRMARLASAFRAEADGELDEYRDAERGRVISSSSSSSVSSSVSSESSSSTVSSSSLSSSSSSSSTQTSLFPAVSHFLVSGEKTPVILDGLFQNDDEDNMLRRVTVLFHTEVKSFSSLSLVDERGTEVVTLALATNNNTDKRLWEALIDDNRYQLIKGKAVRLGIKAVLKPRDDGGVSNELVDLETFRIEVQGMQTMVTRQIVPSDAHYPLHQTSHGRILSVRNALPPGGTVQDGIRKQIASFSVSGQSATGAALAVKGFQFVLQKANLNVSNIRIGSSAEIEQQDCGLEQTDILRITCSTIPDNLKTVGSQPRVLSIFATLAVGDSASTGSLQLLFEGVGKIGQTGGVQWSDGTSNFNWMEAGTVLENGPLWTVTKTPAQ